MYCDSCGKSIPDHTAFCPQCGSPQGKAANPPPIPVAPPPPPPPAHHYSPPPQPVYAHAPVYSAPPQPAGRLAPLTTGQYLVMLLLLWIPLVNFILLLVWSFGDSNQNRKNLSRAMLILMIISFAVIVGVSLAAGGLAAILSGMQ